MKKEKIKEFLVAWSMKSEWPDELPNGKYLFVAEAEITSDEDLSIYDVKLINNEDIK